MESSFYGYRKKRRSIWSIHPDGTNWEPVVSAYWTGGAPPAFHFQSQLSDKSIVVEQYYNLNNSGFVNTSDILLAKGRSGPLP